MKHFRTTLKLPDCDRNQSLPDFVGPSGYDRLCTALRHLTRNCTHVNIGGPIHPALLLDQTPQSSSSTGTLDEPVHIWRDLVKLEIRPDMRQSHGRWLFNSRHGALPSDEPCAEIDPQQMPPGYGSTPEELEDAENFFDDNEEVLFPPEEALAGEQCITRTAPDAQGMNALLRGFATCCARLPRLKFGGLQMDCETVPYPWQVVCAAPDVELGFEEVDGQTAVEGGFAR